MKDKEIKALTKERARKMLFEGVWCRPWGGYLDHFFTSFHMTLCDQDLQRKDRWMITAEGIISLGTPGTGDCLACQRKWRLLKGIAEGEDHA